MLLKIYIYFILLHISINMSIQYYIKLELFCIYGFQVQPSSSTQCSERACEMKGCQEERLTESGAGE